MEMGELVVVVGVVVVAMDVVMVVGGNGLMWKPTSSVAS